jgi:hypothetical protein
VARALIEISGDMRSETRGGMGKIRAGFAADAQQIAP